MPIHIPDDQSYEEACAQTAIKSICSKPFWPPLPRDIRKALRQQEIAESRARVAATKQRWNTALDNRVK